MTEVKLPELEGSEKQVSWANKIRFDILESLNSSMEYYSNFPDGKYDAYLLKLIRRVQSVDSAKLFINIRSTWFLGRDTCPGLLIDFKRFCRYSEAGTLPNIEPAHLEFFLGSKSDA